MSKKTIKIVSIVLAAVMILSTVLAWVIPILNN
jgi:hypothetical protein